MEVRDQDGNRGYRALDDADLIVDRTPPTLLNARVTPPASYNFV